MGITGASRAIWENWFCFWFYENEWGAKRASGEPSNLDSKRKQSLRRCSSFSFTFDFERKTNIRAKRRSNRNGKDILCFALDLLLIALRRQWVITMWWCGSSASRVDEDDRSIDRRCNGEMFRNQNIPRPTSFEQESFLWFLDVSVVASRLVDRGHLST